VGKQTKKSRQPSRRVGSNKRRRFDQDYKVAVAKRLLAGESGTQLSRELKIRRSVLYRWRDTYRLEGAAGLNRQPGCPPGRRGRAAPDAAALAAIEQADATQAAATAAAAARRIAELERKIGQQALQIDFLERAFKRVKELGLPSGGSGASGSTAKSAPGSALKAE
jgi:transposase-like protein